MYYELNLQLQELLDCALSVDVKGLDEGVEVEGAEEGVGNAKGKHGGNKATRVLQRKARVGHAVLCGRTCRHDVHVARLVYLLLKVRCLGAPLFSVKNDKVVCCKEAAGVTLGAGDGAENDDVLGDGCMENPHSAHCSSCVVKEPIGFCANVSWVLFRELICDDLKHLLSRLLLSNGILCNLLQNLRVENVSHGDGAVLEWVSVCI
mmetsp:Transcript_21261/g.66531  ORF Transcript_21261/g.66531 Transcript_21261/m.66531 type:complete len:206 (-) Transcript_21261:14-631(-)